MIEKLESSEELLRTVRHECEEVGRTKKAMPVYQQDYVSVALRELDRRNDRSTFEAGKAARLHSARLPEIKYAREALEFAPCGNLA
jgi:hypothetical protein